MVNTTSRAVLIGVFIGILLTHLSTCQCINSTSTSPPNSHTQSITNLLNFSSISAISNIFTTISQVLTYLDPPLVVSCLLTICGSVGILFAGGKYGTSSVNNSFANTSNWSIYTLLHRVVLGLSAGMELFVIIFLNLTLLIPLACSRWLLDQQEMIRWRLKIMVFQMGMLISEWFKAIFDGMIGEALISILVGLWDVLFHWKRQGHGGMLQAVVLIPSLVFALFVNMVMYFMLFLPVTGLGWIWDFLSAELKEVGDGDGSEGCMRTPSLCMSESISELDLNDGGEESDADSGACASLAGGEKTSSLLCFQGVD